MTNYEIHQCLTTNSKLNEHKIYVKKIKRMNIPLPIEIQYLR